MPTEPRGYFWLYFSRFGLSPISPHYGATTFSFMAQLGKGGQMMQSRFYSLSWLLHRYYNRSWGTVIGRTPITIYVRALRGLGEQPYSLSLGLYVLSQDKATLSLNHTNQSSSQPSRTILIHLTHGVWLVQGWVCDIWWVHWSGELHACRGADIATISVEEPHRQRMKSSIAI